MVKEDARRKENAYAHFFEWVDSKLSPAFGESAPVAYDDTERPAPQSACPICGHVMEEHEIERSTLNTVVECPTGERLPLKPDNEPLDEFGMPASAERREKVARRH
ncbi:MULTISPECIES: hypothetical protein [unclassified Leifsonia]|uniref:hypothetical protein n=1 Tax=unclassified Leifsonia TaxID=2663824 RepID=UPI0012FB679D|nr:MULTISPECIES: hypothetical protein [unclassified Leifsonia]